MAEADVRSLLEGALELGINLIDSARSYGEAEGRIARHLGPQRDQFVLSTKLGYGVEGVPDWTGPSVTGGIERALRTLTTDRIDIVHLHSCPRSVLEGGEVVEALYAARSAGKVRAAAYSGDGAALAWAVTEGNFDSVQASFSLCDRANRPILEDARARGLGVMAKRPLANAPWRAEADREDPYQQRWEALALEVEDPFDVALRYAMCHGPADVTLLGTRSLVHLREAVEAMNRGPLSEAQVGRFEARWAELGQDWPAHI